MSATLIILTFIVVWWIALFAVLPWGVKPQERPGRLDDPGAPANPGLWRKFAINTLISVLLTGFIVWLVETPLIKL